MSRPNMSNLLSSVILAVSLFGKCCHMQFIGAGFCPRLYGMRNFNVTQYQGLWYEVEKYWFFPEASSVCISTYVTDKHDGTFLSEITTYEQLSMKKWKMTALNSYKEGYKTASFNMELFITQSPIPFAIKVPWIMLDTDYTSYAVHYFCRTAGVVNFQGLWIFSRKKTLDAETRDYIYTNLNILGLNVYPLKFTEQTECPP